MVTNSSAGLEELALKNHRALQVKQVREIAELIGFETRNKYQISDSQGQAIGFAAEQQKGFLGILFRMVLGHWRSFTIHIFDTKRRLVLQVEHPFRWILQRLEVRTVDGRLIGSIQQRFSILTKRFDVEDGFGKELFVVASPIWKIWTFEFRRHGVVVGAVKKKWSGALSEIFTDRDNFLVEFSEASESSKERALMLAAAIFIDLQYFEAKAS